MTQTSTTPPDGLGDGAGGGGDLPTPPLRKGGLRLGEVFYGWIMVGAIFFTLSITSGLGFYNASVILRAAVDELDTTVSAVSGATALFFGISGLTGFVLARVMDRVDIRWFYVAGGISGSVALLGLRWVDSVPKLYLFFGLFGISFAAGGLVPGTTLIARWFSRRRSVALSIASSGLSFGGIALTPFAARLIENRSLSGAGPWMALAWLLGVLPVAVWLLRSNPSELGLEPDGDPTPPTPIPIAGATFGAATATRFFRFLSVTYAMVFLAQVGALAQLFNLVAERVDSGTAATALSTLAFASVAGRLAGGLVVTRISTRSLTAALVLVQALALSLVAVSDSTAALIASSALFGLSVGNLLMLQPLILAETFGVREYSRIYSLNQLIGTLGVAGGPFLLGVLRDGFDYRVSFLVAAGLNVVGFVTLMLAGPIETARASWNAEPTPAL